MNSKEVPDQAVALTDRDIVKYVLSNCLPDDGYGLCAPHWPKFSKDEQEDLGKRIRDASMKADEMDKLRPLSFTQINEQPVDSASVSDTSADAPQTTNLDPESLTLAQLLEVDLYNLLVERGGRPVYPISAIQDVWRNEEKYQDLFIPWIRRFYFEPCTDQFYQQVQTWGDFCKWRCEKRGVYNKDAEFSLYVEARKRRIRLSAGEQQIPELKVLMSQFERQEAFRRAKQRDLIKDHKDGDFPGYIEAIKRCLDNHGFKKSFQLRQDPDQQDDITTWIEYLGYEYLWYDRVLGMLEPLQPHYDEQWKKLVNRKVVSPYETRETSKLLKIEERIDNELLAAKWERITLDERKHEFSHQEYYARFWENEARIRHARDAKRLYIVREKKIDEFDEETRDYKNIKQELKQRGYLVSWIQQQIAQIEEESKEKKTGESEDIKGKGKAVRFALNDEREAGPSRTNAKRKHSDVEDSDGEQQTTSSSKRSKTQHQEETSGIDASTQTLTRNTSVHQGRKVRGSVRSRGQAEASATDVTQSRGTGGNGHGNGQKVTRHSPKKGSSAGTNMSGVKPRRSKRIASLPKPKYT
ncbi:hypothetical protein F4809DRAFT_628848 [Biscogniauxia mediterranea]|nr:hypothetical protein F4809DRAFT_628848 [Biscogniauxia mediterranea]